MDQLPRSICTRLRITHHVRFKRIVELMVLFVAAFCPLHLLRAQLTYATPYTFTTLVGGSGAGSADGTGSTARFNNPQSVAVDALGNVYVADRGNYTVRKITPAGVVTTLAGTVGQFGSDDGPGSTAKFSAPAAVAVDSTGTVYVADLGNCTIRKISSAGVVTTWVGLSGNPGTADGTGAAARFDHPDGLTIDSADYVYVADSWNHIIRKISPTGVVTTFAGSVTSGSSDGQGAAAQFDSPGGLAVDALGNIYVADTTNQTIRKITPGGLVSTLAGTVGAGGFVNDTGAAAKFSYPQAVTVDGAGNVYVADSFNSAIRKITPGGGVTTFAGPPSVLPGGSRDGTGSTARFADPQGIAIDNTGHLYVADTLNCTIRKITPGATVTTFAGRSTSGAEDGPLATARLGFISGVAVDSADNIFVADTTNNTIRKIALNGTISTFAGSAADDHGSTDGVGTDARFFYPTALAVDPAGTIYVADSQNFTIRKITAAGAVTTFAGAAGQYGTNDGAGSAARFGVCYGIALDGTGTVYVADTNNHAIRKITPDGTVTTLAGLAGSFGSTDGTGSAARFRNPIGLVVDPAGNVYVADNGNNLIRKISSGGVVTTLTGTSGSFFGGFTDGALADALFTEPSGLTRDTSGNLYVADHGSHIIRKISPSGFVTTLAGYPHGEGQVDGIGSAVRFKNPVGLALNSAGVLYVADIGNGAIRRGYFAVRGDFSFDGHKDIVWENKVTGDRALWLMNGTVFISGVALGNLAPAWRIAGAADFNNDAKTDILWENTATGDRIVWFMEGSTFVSSVDLGIVPTVWRMAATADFDGDTKTDILLENTSTGERVVWLMDGINVRSTISYGTISTQWRIAASADFNHDGQIDIVWENTVTGQHTIWLMNGTVFSSAIDFGSIPTQWRLATVGDFNGDGDADFFWENTVTGDRALWLMHGTVYSSAIYFGSIPTDWRITP